MNLLGRLGILLWVVMAVCSCNKETEKVVILATNDMHAQISRFPQLAAFVEQKRAEGGEVIVVDAGDRFSGNPYVDNAGERGEPMIQLMNKVGYEVACMGNHDFDYGQQTLKKRLEEANFPVLCANMVSENSELGALSPYYILEKGGLKFCFFSLIQTGTNHIPATNPGNLENISFRYYKDVAREYKQLAKDCDVMIGLTHLGFAHDSLLALVMPDFDVIVGGHSHTVIREPQLINGVLVTQTGSNLNYVGVTTLEFKRKRLVSKSYALVSLKDFETADEEVALMVEKINNRPEFKKVVGQAGADLSTKEEVASLMTDAMCEAAGCDFAFYNKGGVRLNSIPKGDITMEMLYKLEPFANYIVKYEWNLERMKEFILRDYNRVAEPEKRYINYFISAGRYEIVRDAAGNGVDVRFYDKQGKLLRNENKYKVAVSNYVASAGKLGEEGVVTHIPITEAVVGYLGRQGCVAYEGGRTRIK